MVGGSITEEMPKHCTINEITNTFNSVGLGSVTSWLKPYHVLSNGEKMRVDLAYNLLSNTDLIVFDEFTSVVDRDIAKTTALAVQKNIRRTNKKFIAISCHFDIINWLMPDWVYNTDDGSFFLKTDWRKPVIKLQIYQITNQLGQKIWKTFSKYHYLNGNLSKISDCFVGVYNNKLVCFCAVKQLAFHSGKKTIHRLVVLPEFQGIGIGTNFLNKIVELYINCNWQVHIVTSNRGLKNSLLKNKHWHYNTTKLNVPVIRKTTFKDGNNIKNFKGGSNLNNTFTREISSFKTNKEIYYK